ncbi:ATPase [Cereibacter sphaeroides]|uniref:sensor histidine kinase n=1 Tax=Cereibacter sphaeroides TaxID=1063 RepID=UPI000E5C45E7|nr:sensor histidine kinase [Cereibacter sphaeroides]RHZ92001.1 ATPase [Cereibacter sphaeroides]
MPWTKNAKGHGPIPLNKWLWRSYIKAALVPLLLIEFGFVGVYLITSEVVYDRSASAITRISEMTLRDDSIREADIIAHRLQSISATTRIFSEETARALATPDTVSDEEKARHSLSPEGVFYTTKDTGGAAVFYSGIVPVGESEREKVWRTVRLDPLMKSIKDSDPLIAQLYLNTWDSYNRIYPYFDVLDIYPPKMDIPSYNFYYEADRAHNPAGGAVWTDAYVDPAGEGWMVSSIAPVHGPDRLEAVVGIDVTIKTIVEQVLDIKMPGDGFAVLIGRDGTILALPPKGEDRLGMNELIGHTYAEAILQDTFKPAEFNIFRRLDLASIALQMQAEPAGVSKIDLQEPMIAAWSTVQGPNWRLLLLTSERSLLTEATNLRNQLGFVSTSMVAILVLFYAGFFAYLWRRSVAMSARVARPLGDLEQRMILISEGGTVPPSAPFEIQELQTVGEHLATMGDKLDAANRAKSNFLSSMSHELRTPLTAIIGYAELLETSEGRKLDGERLQQVQAISTAGWNLVKLVDAVLELSRLEHRDLRLATSSMDLMPLIEEALSRARPDAERMRVTLRILAPKAPLPSVVSDPALLRRILDQLLSNAVKYNLPDGLVEISFGLEAPDTVDLSIRDTGPGIPTDRQAEVFQAFQRLGHENGAISGAGIGLTIAQRLAEVSGCRLSLESTPGEGTIFLLRIPRTRQGAPGAA